MSALTPDTKPFHLATTRAESKAEITNRTAQAIIDAEKHRREAKTERLRRARLINESINAGPGVPANGAKPASTGKSATANRAKPAKATVTKTRKR